MRYGLPEFQFEVDDNKCQDYKTIYSRLTPEERKDWMAHAGGRKRSDLKGGAMHAATLASGRRQINLYDKNSDTYFGFWWYE
jgi:hypothetical protein